MKGEKRKVPGRVRERKPGGVAGGEAWLEGEMSEEEGKGGGRCRETEGWKMYYLTLNTLKCPRQRHHKKIFSKESTH